MNDTIADVAALEAVIGKTPGPMHLKVIDHVDDSARRWIAASPLCFIAFGDAGGIVITLAGGARGFAQAVGDRQLRLPAAMLDAPQLARVGEGVGALFLAPGIGETLRVNGRVAAADGSAILIDVLECYVHCAKALIRSGFWNAAPLNQAPQSDADFLDASRFMALATIDREGRADLSPKGDPAGTMLRWHDGAAWYADRPGNRRVDSFRNILVQPQVAAAALIPGSTRIALLSGRARIAVDAAMRERFAVGGKTPLLATCIEQPQLQLQDSAALARAQLWPAGPRDPSVDPAAAMVAHIKLNKIRGLQASLVRATLSVPGLMEKGLERDYKHNLY